MKKALINNWSYVVSFIFLFICLIYVILNGQNIVIPIHDNLDSNLVWLKMLKDNELTFKISGEIPFLGGIDRNYLYSPFKVYLWFYDILPVFWAYIVTSFLKVIISIIGFVFLGKVINKNFDLNKHIFVFCGLLYGLAPTYPTSAFSFASIPFLAAFLILYYRNPKPAYLTFFLLYPIFSDITFFGIFICGYLFLYILWKVFKEKRFELNLFFPLFTLFIGYLIADFNIFYTMIFSSETSLRAEMVNEVYNLKESIKLFVEGLLFGHYHCGSLHTFVVLPVCFIFILLHWQKTRWCLNKNNDLCEHALVKYQVNIIFALIILNSIIYTLNYFAPVKNFISSNIPLLSEFSYARTLWLNPFLWYLLFAVVLSEMTKIRKLRYIFILAAIIVICVCKSEYNHLQINIEALRYNLKHKPLKTLTYKEFYSEKLFDKIKKDIKYNGEWSCAFAMHPAVIEYNGIKTLDGYLSYYPLSYKNKFKKLIEPELLVNKKYSDYFNEWGGRAYLYSKEATFSPIINFDIDNAPLRINSDILKEMNGVYVFSRIKISNYKELGFKFINKYTEKNSKYEIYVYKI